MINRTILAIFAVSICLWSAPSHAKWTKWYNLNNKNDTNELLDIVNNKNRYRTIPKRVECKADNKGVWIRVDNRPVHAGGMYYLKIGFKKNLEAELKQQKKRGVNVLSRSEVETTRGMVSCMVWRKPSW